MNLCLIVRHREVKYNRLTVRCHEIAGNPARDKDRIRFPEEPDRTERQELRVARPETKAYEHAARPRRAA